MKNEITNENKRFYLSWGLFVIVFALSLIIQSLYGNLVISTGFFFTALAICLIIIGYPTPSMPLVVQLGGIFLGIGIAVLGIFYLHIDPLIVIGVLILIGGVILLMFKGRKING